MSGFRKEMTCQAPKNYYKRKKMRKQQSGTHGQPYHIHSWVHIGNSNLGGMCTGTETQTAQKSVQNEGQWQRGGGSERVKGRGKSLESIRWLSWSCLHSCGSESGREAREGTRVWVLCHERMYSYKHRHTKTMCMPAHWVLSDILWV